MAATRIWRNSTGPRSAIRRCGRCCAAPGFPNCATRPRLGVLRAALRQARDETSPDWAAIGAPVAALLDTIELSHPKPRACRAAGARANARRDRAGDPRLRRASLALVCQQRLHPDLCRVQPDRRSRSARPRNVDGADGTEFARLQELDLLFNLARDLHRALAGARADQSALARASPSRCGSRCRSATARPITTRSSPRRC